MPTPLQRFTSNEAQAASSACSAGRVYLVEIFDAAARIIDGTGLGIHLIWRPEVVGNRQCGRGQALAGNNNGNYTPAPTDAGVALPFPTYHIDLAAFFAPAAGELKIVGAPTQVTAYVACNDRALLPQEIPPPWQLTFPNAPVNTPIVIARSVPGAYAVTDPFGATVIDLIYGGTTVTRTTVAGVTIPLAGVVSVSPTSGPATLVFSVQL